VLSGAVVVPVVVPEPVEVPVVPVVVPEPVEVPLVPVVPPEAVPEVVLAGDLSVP
jgi:hypothetical protein